MNHHLLKSYPATIPPNESRPELAPTIPWKRVYPLKVEIQIVVDWPETIQYNGSTYHRKYKEAVRLQDNCPSELYSRPAAGGPHWIWHRLDGSTESIDGARECYHG